jgi:hypothetical protein
MVTGATAATPAWMKASFRPTNRIRDIMLSRYNVLYQECVEVELLPFLTPEDVLATADIAWDDVSRFLQGKVVWMTPEVFVSTGNYLTRICFPFILSLGVNSHQDLNLSVHVVTRDTPAAAAAATCEFLLRLLATSKQHEVYIEGSYGELPPPLSGAGITRFFQESRSCLQKVTLEKMTLNEDQCRALETMPRLDVELEMRKSILSNDASGAFVECLRGGGGPVKLNRCHIDTQILASALAGNSRVTMLKLLFEGVNHADMAILVAALANNRGLLDLRLQHRPISDENWSVLCESLQAHPTLTSLDLSTTGPRSPDGDSIGLSDEQKAHRTRLLAEMVQKNTVLNTITLLVDETDQQIYAEMIQPYLETNLYRPRVHAIKKADVSIRRPLLGRALQTESVREKSNRLWMLLSGNPDVVSSRGSSNCS